MTTTARGAGRRSHRGALLAAAVTAVPLVAALPATVSAPIAAAADVDYFGPDPATALTMELFRNGGDQDELGGILCQSPRTCVSVPFPYLERRVGAEDLNNAIVGDTSGQPLIVFGYSQGARVASEWLEEHAGTEGAPSPEELSFVLIGNPGRKHGGAHVIWGQPTPDTEYDILDVARQYDLTADRPDRFQLLAIMNAYAGLTQLHGHYEDVDIYDPANYVWKEGNTTYVFVPTENLPILEPLRRLGLDDLADRLNDPLKEKIERAYDRSYLPAEPGWPTQAEPQPEAPPTDPVTVEATPTALRTTRSMQASVQTPVTEQSAAATSAAGAETGADVAKADTADVAKPARQTHRPWHKKARGDRDADASSKDTNDAKDASGNASSKGPKDASGSASSSESGNTSGAGD